MEGNTGGDARLPRRSWVTNLTSCPRLQPIYPDPVSLRTAARDPPAVAGIGRWCARRWLECCWRSSFFVTLRSGRRNARKVSSSGTRSTSIITSGSRWRSLGCCWNSLEGRLTRLPRGCRMKSPRRRICSDHRGCRCSHCSGPRESRRRAGKHSRRNCMGWGLRIRISESWGRIGNGCAHRNWRNISREGFPPRWRIWKRSGRISLARVCTGRS